MIAESEVSEWQKRLDRLADARQREQTAATILAQLLALNRRGERFDREMVAEAVALADALRAELAK